MSASYPARRPVLSERELEVLQLAAIGVDNEATAMMLCISRQTVRTHRQSILSSMWVHTMGHAIATAMREGWIE